MEGKLITDKVALQTIIGLKFVKKNDIVLIQYNGTKPESKMFWNVILNTAESVRLKQNITAKDILDSLNHTDYVQISQTMIINTKASCGRNDPAWKHKLNEIPIAESSINERRKK